MPSPVTVRSEEMVFPTYLPSEPDRNPMFLEKRVYQGSSGRVYPLPFTDRVAETPVNRVWRAVWIENEYLRAMVLPELGGRVHVLQDKTNGYDLIYRQDVIKPALVGLAGPWISGGIEFNWPQHHRPATFLPVDWTVEEHADGSRTIWCADHDPMARMRAAHGICLHPGRACLELKVRLHNRTPWVQTFLWWANVATRVHEDYQSFFPPDVRYVADHAKRAMSEFPCCRGVYYGVDYGARAGERIRPPGGGPERAVNDLSWYANIPTPCSYMAMGSREDFFGGYDHRAQAGLVHIADHRIAPGKKQWTWGNHPFGWAWDRNLTDATSDGEYRPYIELMAGVFTDNQPDFSFLMPGESRAWSQYWYPIQKIGPAHHANLRAAVRVDLGAGRVSLGVSVTEDVGKARIRLERLEAGGNGGEAGEVLEWVANLAPGRPWWMVFDQPASPWKAGSTALSVRDAQGRVLLEYEPAADSGMRIKVPAPATEPAAPAEMPSPDELFVTGLHLDQYRHATRCPTAYWREALRRDPGDARCNTALGIWHLKRGEWGEAEGHLRRAVERLTRRNPNPADGESLYHLGLCLRFRAWASPEDAARADRCRREAYDLFFKSTWNRAWAGPAYVALAEMDGERGDWEKAREHAGRAATVDGDNPRASWLWVLAMRRTGLGEHAEVVQRSRQACDPLDACWRDLAGRASELDAQTRLDLAHDYARVGLVDEAVRVLTQGPEPSLGVGDLMTRDWGAGPLVEYTLGWLEARRGRAEAAQRHRTHARMWKPDYCFPARLEEILVLESALHADPHDARAAYYLGNLLYDRRRHEEAMQCWERSAELDPSFSVVWRNLGMGWFNVRRHALRAQEAYEKAVAAAPGDARLVYERDQLWKRMRVRPSVRLRELARHPGPVWARDDLAVEWCDLLNHAGRHAAAAVFLAGRRFQPWEGGEGLVLAQHERTYLGLARKAMEAGDPAQAGRWLVQALEVPSDRGEDRHLLTPPVEIWYRLACAREASGDATEAKALWRRAAAHEAAAPRGTVRGETTLASARSALRLGRLATARRWLRALRAEGRALRGRPATVDYFATSLPTLLLFEDDLQARQAARGMFLEAQAELGLNRVAAARVLLREVLSKDPAHAGALDLWREIVGATQTRGVVSRGASRANRTRRKGR